MNAAPSTLTCPKCGAEMRSYERNRVIIDQCVECRGIFLDRGELESLIDAEGAYYADSPAPSPRATRPQSNDYDPRNGRGGGHHGGGHGSGRGRRRGGFLGELFD